jgi:hypothetical protein
MHLSSHRQRRVRGVTCPEGQCIGDDSRHSGHSSMFRPTLGGRGPVLGARVFVATTWRET